MIVPRDRMLVAFVAAVLPAALLAATPRYAAVALSAIAAFLLIAGLDALLAVGRLRRVRVYLPQVLRTVRARPSSIPVTVQNDGVGIGTLRVGLAIPPPVGCAEPDVILPAPAPGEACQVQLPCTPVRRGLYRLTTAVSGLGSPMGLWEARRRIPVQCEVRVYPDLLGGQRELAPLLLRRPTGLHVQRQVGRGREFEKLREYLPGDPMSDIHWKGTARRARPVTRVYQVERAQENYIALDCSRLTARRGGEGTVLDRYVAAALALTLASRQQGDLLGLVVFSDSVHSFLRAGNAGGHYDACRNALFNLEPRIVTPDYAELFAALQTRLRRRAMILFLTELGDPVLAEDFQAGIAPLSRVHLVAAASVRETEVAPLFETPAGTLDDVYERLAGHLAWRRLEELRVRLRAAGIRFLPLDPARLSIEVARLYLNAKRQQAI